jgi:hypothetical protein
VKFKSEDSAGFVRQKKGKKMPSFSKLKMTSSSRVPPLRQDSPPPNICTVVFACNLKVALDA